MTDVGPPPASEAPQPSSPPPTRQPTTKPAPQKTTFTSCLSIPAPGAVAKAKLPPETPVPEAPQPPAVTSMKRAPRKSKTDALAAMNARSESPSVGPPAGPGRGMVSVNVPSLASGSKGPSRIRSAPLDMSTVRTPGSLRIEDRSGPRNVFGLEECVTFRPTELEFKDPLRYINSITPIGKRHGICKIIPPDSWRMPFVVDTETFRFTTRVQRLNSIEASARDRINFLEKLYRFHKQQGDSRVSIPIVSQRPVDLWQFKKEVQNMGGYENVTKTRQWADIGRRLGYLNAAPLSSQLKQAYAKVILPFDNYVERVRNSPQGSPLTPWKNTNNRSNPASPTPGRMTRFQNTSPSKPGRSAMKPVSADGTPLLPSSPLSDPPDGPELQDGQSARSKVSDPVFDQDGDVEMEGTPLNTAPFQPLPISPPERPIITGEACEICKIDNDGAKMLLCDGCDAAYHIYCLDPPLPAVPRSQWFCHSCLFGTGGDYGFEEGEEHSLTSFQIRDTAFQNVWFGSHPPQPLGQENDRTGRVVGAVRVTEDDVEREFWRLVQSPLETVEIEYGADVHSTTHGSASPTPETHPLNSYSKDGWNLNNLPILPDSLLRYIKSDISGMTVPWIYVGMLFSTFCWHNEDHYTYSINYMHWGETKTWYGIPSEDADKFETAIKSEAPDLFEAQPDLLFQLVTLMSPERLRKVGVRVFACNQRAGELVITFPQAYHSGFNHGFNFNEAVNFALPDWLPHDLACVRRYQEHAKMPVFSHDELLITVTQHSTTIKTALWLEISIKEMQRRELDGRERVVTKMPDIQQVLEQQDRPEEQYQCFICKAFCYLSQISCECTVHVTCLDHAERLCACHAARKVLRQRFSEEQINNIVLKVSERASVPTTWRQKFRKLLAESGRPPLKNLRTLVAEGDRIAVELPELLTLKKCVERANRWVEEASVFTTRKLQSRQKKGRKTRASALDDGAVDTPPPDNESKRGIEDVEKLIREYDFLGIHATEFSLLVDVRQQALNFAASARVVLDQPSEDESLADCEALLAQGSSLNVQLNEFSQLDKRAKRVHFMREADRLGSRRLSLDEIKDYVARAHACDVPQLHPILRELEHQKSAGEAWRARANRCLERIPILLSDLEAAINRPLWVPTDAVLMTRLENLRAKAKHLDQHALAVLKHIPIDGGKPPSVDDLRKLLARADNLSSPNIERLTVLLEQASDLEVTFELILNQPSSALDMKQRPRGLEHLRRVCDWAEDHLCPHMTLQWVERMMSELDEHESWLEELPDFLTKEPNQQPEMLLRDIISQLRSKKRPLPQDCTCICTEPSANTALNGAIGTSMKCDNCSARFHATCNMNSCPFCDSTHWESSPPSSTRRPAPFLDMVNTAERAPTLTRRFCNDYHFINQIIEHCRAFTAELTTYLSKTHGIEDIYRIRCYMRTLYWLYVDWDGPDSHGPPLAAQLSQLYRALVDKYRGALHSPKLGAKRLRNRKPKFYFQEDETYCLCGNEDSQFPKIICSHCARGFHRACVLLNPLGQRDDAWRCPMCCVRAGRDYLGSDVRVVMPDSDDFLDYKETMRRITTVYAYPLEQAHRPTIHLHLTKVLPGAKVDDDGNTSPGPLDTPPHPTVGGPFPPMHTSVGNGHMHGFSHPGFPVEPGRVTEDTMHDTPRRADKRRRLDTPAHSMGHSPAPVELRHPSEYYPAPPPSAGYRRHLGGHLGANQEIPLLAPKPPKKNITQPWIIRPHDIEAWNNGTWTRHTTPPPREPPK